MTQVCREISGRAVSAAARPSSTICVFRPGAEGFEVLMVRRHEGARFMGGAWVFPGGALDDLDRSELAGASVSGVSGDDLPWVAAALRELAEEAGVWVTVGEPPAALMEARPHGEGLYRALTAAGTPFAGDRLALFAHWITPAIAPVRFDTRFYAVEVDAGTVAAPDQAEVDRAAWVTADVALANEARGEWIVPFPTRKTLAHVANLGGASELIAAARANPAIDPILPRIAMDPDGTIRVVLPDEPGFDDLGEDEEASADLLARLAKVAPEVRSGEEG